jgi:hypothetical protein
MPVSLSRVRNREEVCLLIALPSPYRPPRALSLRTAKRSKKPASLSRFPAQPLQNPALPPLNSAPFTPVPHPRPKSHSPAAPP